MNLYNKATVDNPMANIEDLYSKGGLDALEMNFIYKVTGQEHNYGHKLNLKNDFYIYVSQDQNTLNIHEDKYFFIDEVLILLNRIESETLIFFKKRLDQANSESEVQYNLRKAERVINKARDFIIDNPEIIYADKHYDFLKSLLNKVRKTYTSKTGDYILATQQITDEQIQALAINLWKSNFMEKDDFLKFRTFLRARDIVELSGTLKIGFNNRLFRYLLDKMYDYSILKLNFTDLIHSGFFLNNKGNPFKINDLYSAKTNKPPKNHEMIDKVFLEILGKKI